MSGFELVGAIAAAGQFMVQGHQALHLGHAILSNIQDAPADIQSQLAALDILNSLAENIRSQTHLQTPTTERILQRCQELAVELQGVLRKISFEKSDGIVKKTWKAAAGVHYEPFLHEIRTKLEQEKASLLLLISTINSSKLADIDGLIRAVQSHNVTSTDSERCLRDLFLSDPIYDREELFTRKGEIVTVACDWITENSDFCSWLQNPMDFLWVCGGPGVGKTMLSMYISKYLEAQCAAEDKDSRVIYFFCDNKNLKRNTATAVLRGLIFQLVQQDLELIKTLLPLYNVHNEKLFDEASFEPLWGIFMTILRGGSSNPTTAADKNNKRTICILDGLDECEDDSVKLLLKKIQSLYLRQETEPVPLRLMVVSREIFAAAFAHARHVKLDRRPEITRGVELYITIKVEELSYASISPYTPAFRETVEKVLRERSRGTFLWVSFVIEEFRDKSPLEVEACLESLPSGLNELYERMLGQVPDARRVVVQQVLTWVTYARGTLTLAQLAAALRVQRSKLLSEADVILEYVSYCGHFLRVGNGRNAKEEKNNPKSTVSLVHQSVQDFFTTRVSTPGFPERGLQVVNADIASVCVQCMEEVIGPVAVNSSSPMVELLGYAIFCWAEHLRLAETKILTVVDGHSKFFGKVSTTRNKAWELMRRQFPDLRSAPPLLQMAAFLGLDYLVEKLVLEDAKWFKFRRRGKRLNRVENSTKTPLSYAVLGNRTTTVLLLLRLGADPRGNTAGLPLVEAISGSPQVVEALLSHGADPNEFTKEDENNKPQQQTTPLIEAASWALERTAATQLLLQAGADHLQTDSQGNTALMKAASFSPPVAHVLLDWDSSLSHLSKPRNNIGQDVFALALRGGDLDLIRRLTTISNSSNNNNNNNNKNNAFFFDPRTTYWRDAGEEQSGPLHWTISNCVSPDQTPKILSYFLSSPWNLDPNSPTTSSSSSSFPSSSSSSSSSSSYTPIHYLSLYPDPDPWWSTCLDILLSHGADVNAVTATRKSRQTALHILLDKPVPTPGSAVCMRALLDRGADPGLRDGGGVGGGGGRSARDYVLRWRGIEGKNSRVGRESEVHLAVLDEFEGREVAVAY